MADALLFANRYLERNGDSAATDRMIMLLADGQNDCGDVAQAMASLQASGIIFRHETVGFGITPNSRAAQDLRQGSWMRPCASRARSAFMQPASWARPRTSWNPNAWQTRRPISARLAEPA